MGVTQVLNDLCPSTFDETLVFGFAVDIIFPDVNIIGKV